MKKGSLFLLLTVLFLTSCDTSQKNISREEQIEKIVKMENDYRDSQATTHFMENVQKLLAGYGDFINQYPQDALSPEFLMRASIVALNSHQESYAVTLLSRLYNDYPESPLRPEALFRQAYINDDFLGYPDRAKALYEEFLVMFPNDPLAKDAEQLLKFVDQDPEEFIKFLLEQGEPVEGDPELAI
ncbi:hypothetical protein LJB78_00770 [Bacteroidales bacterium OttesenSCG-928-J16]|nr:hypothetical protein [Bacteroidales bacterium OttesenSCG-928-J16]